jgi:hypothetical protein
MSCGFYGNDFSRDLNAKTIADESALTGLRYDDEGSNFRLFAVFEKKLEWRSINKFKDDNMAAINQLLKQHGLYDNHVYLLELIPLIQMMWADGKNQEEEIAILNRFAMQHLARLSRLNDGVMPISVEATNEFLKRFTQSPPSDDLLDDLKSLCIGRLTEKSDASKAQFQADNIINFCIDIAAACAEQYPYEFDERIVIEEKRVLRNLMQEFDFDSP